MAAPKGNKYAKGLKHSGRPKKYTLEWMENEAKLFEEWMKKKDSVFIKQFAVERGYLSSYFADFAAESKVFDDVLKRAKEWQETRLLSLGLYNHINPYITKFVLVNHHNYSSEPKDVKDNKSKTLLEAIAKELTKNKQ